MRYFFWTLSHQFKEIIENAFIFPVWISLAGAILFIIVYRVKNKSVNRKTVTDKILPLSLMIFIFSMIIQLTLFSRIGQTVDSFSNIWGNWGFIKQDYSFDLSCIENIIMFIPLPMTVNWFICKFKGRKLATKKILFFSTLISFCLSMFIEVNQILFSIGLFQTADLFYNTLGGVLGAILYIIIRKELSKG